MDTMRLGRTDLIISRTGFGALPIQRVDFDTARSILRRAYEAGITFFDTARGYPDSEEKIGYALADVRDDIVLATKIPPCGSAAFAETLQTCLTNLKTDHVDLLQLHLLREIPDPDDPHSCYAPLKEAQQKGMTRFVGATCHALDVALAAAHSGLFDTVQFPISAISNEDDLALIDICKQNDVGLIAMKALCGGLLTNARIAFAFFRQYENVVPIWGIQRLSELEEFLALENDPPALDEAMLAEIAGQRRELGDEFCRGCGYCLPCPAEIPVPMAARMAYVIRRLPAENFLTAEWQEKMRRIEDCTDCGHCRENCPYHLDPPALMKKMYQDYQTFLP